MSLPSFSGGTPNHPGFLKYACDLITNVKVVPGIHVRCPGGPTSEETASDKSLQGLLSGRPLLTLQFDDMLMRVEKPVPVKLQGNQSLHPSRALQLA